MNNQNQQPAPPTPSEDLAVLRKVCEAYRGSLQEHITLQKAMERLAAVCAASSAPPEEPPKRGRPKGSKNRKADTPAADKPSPAPEPDQELDTVPETAAANANSNGEPEEAPQPGA